MLPTSPKPVEFVDAAPADAFVQSADTTMERRIPASLDGMNGDGLPSYSSIISTEESIPWKVQQVYSVSKQHIQNQFATVRPWGEFFDRSYFVSPAGTSDVLGRLSRNGSYFYSNYIILSLVCSSYIVLINLPFFICMTLSALAYGYIKKKAAQALEGDGLIYFGERGFSSTQLYVVLIIFAGLSFWITSGSSAIFWLVLTSVGVSSIHASFRRPALEDSVFEFA